PARTARPSPRPTAFCGCARASAWTRARPSPSATTSSTSWPAAPPAPAPPWSPPSRPRIWPPGARRIWWSRRCAICCGFGLGGRLANLRREQHVPDQVDDVGHGALESNGPEHPVDWLPLLPSGPGGVHQRSVARDRLLFGIGAGAKLEGSYEDSSMACALR